MGTRRPPSTSRLAAIKKLAREAALNGWLDAEIQQRDGRWVIVDLRGKHGPRQNNSEPGWVKLAVDLWAEAAGITEGRLLRSLNRHGQITGSSPPRKQCSAVRFYASSSV
jgi:hypothetical protein